MPTCQLGESAVMRVFRLTAVNGVETPAMLIPAVLVLQVHVPEVAIDGAGRCAGHLAAGRTPDGSRPIHLVQHRPCQDSESRCANQKLG